MLKSMKNVKIGYSVLKKIFKLILPFTDMNGIRDDVILDGWMDELGFYVPSTVFQSFRDDGRVNMKGSVQ